MEKILIKQFTKSGHTKYVELLEELIESCRNTIMKNLTATLESKKADYELFSV